MSFFINNRLSKFRIFNLTLFFEIFLPIILTKLFFEVGKPEKLSIMNDSFIIYFSFLWIFVSYIIGRFSNYNSINKNNYYGLTYKSKEAVITNVIIFLLFFLIKFFGLYKLIELDNLIYLLLVFNVFSLIKEILVLKILDNKFSGHFIKISFLGEKKELVHFKKILKDYNFNKRTKLKIKLFQRNSEETPDQIIISDKNQIDYEDNKFLKKFFKKGVSIFSEKKWFQFELNCLPVELIEEENFLGSKIFYKRDFELRIKRVADIFISILLLIFTLPLMITASFFIWLNDKGPILYKQTREGFLGEKIKIYKLRTMIDNAEIDGPRWASKNDPRITKVGKFLRRTRLDEIPQLISVIKGELSLIGPRPERPAFNKILREEINLYDIRNHIKPGLSGWAQVNYSYGSSKNDAKIKLSYDIFYILNFSFFLDLYIIFKTIRVIFNGTLSKPAIFK